MLSIIIQNNYNSSIAYIILYLRKTEPKGHMYNENKIGPSIEPCGTPLCNLADVKHKFPMQTKNDLSFKYDLNQSKEVPQK